MPITDPSLSPIVDNHNGAGDTEPGGGSDEALRSAIDARLRSQTARLRQLTEQRQRLEAEIQAVQRHVDHLAAIARDLGLDPPLGEPQTESVVERETGPSAPGSRGTRVPARRPAFAAMTLADAAAAVLADGRERHVDELVDLIFDEHSPAQHHAAKSSLASALHVAAKFGRVQRTGPSRFRLADAGEAGDMP